MSEEKLVPKLRFEFSSNWESKKLKDIIQISKEKYNPNSEKTNYKCIELEHLAQETGLLLGYTDSINQNSIKNKFHEDNILFGKLRPYLKKFYYTNFEGVCSSEIWVFNTKEHSRYIYYLIQTKRFLDISNVSSGSKMPRSDWNFMKEFTFSIPDIKTQKETASLFSMIDDKIELLEKKYRVYQDFKRYLMQEIFAQKLRFNFTDDWKQYKLKDVLTVKSSSISINQLEENTGDYPLYGASGFLKNIDFCEMDVDYISIVKDGSGVGNLSFHEKNSSIVNTSQYLLPKKNFNINFLYYLLQTINLMKYVNGSSIPHIYFKDYCIEKINIPSLDEQEKIGKLFVDVDITMENLNKNINATQEFKKGLLQQMFV